ncbi:MAG: DUF4065 domain-containing protein [Endomicrobium sp.]|jgi:uncharacterized phage-associated protein|nr:DUF4065 domain-containing protein [Endomicrobium sp.]
MLVAIDVAKYLLSIVDTAQGQVISNFVLQNLLYFCQGYFLALKNGKEVLFNEDIVVWKFGPVVEAVYRNYKDYGSKSLPTNEITEEIVDRLNYDQKKVIKYVNDVYKFCSFKKVNILKYIFL